MKNLLFSAMCLVCLSACNMGKHYAGLRLGGSSQSDEISSRNLEEKKTSETYFFVDSTSIKNEKKELPYSETACEAQLKMNESKIERQRFIVERKIVSPLRKLASTASCKKLKVKRSFRKVKINNDDVNSGDPFDVVYWILVVLVLLGGAVAEALGINFWIGFFLVLIIITGLILLVLWMLDEL